MKKWIGILLAGLLMITAGCSDNKKTEAPAGGAKKVLVVGSNPTFAPFEFVDASGKITGFDMELIQLIGKQMGMEVEIKNVAFDGLIPALQKGDLDIAISGMTITEKRKESIIFSDSYYKSGLGVLVKKENTNINSFKELDGKKVAVQIGSTSAIAAQKIQNGKITQFNQTPEGLLELKNGNVDAVINDLPALQHFLKTDAGKDFKLVGEVVAAEDLGIGINPKKKELAGEINKALGELKKNGEYEKLYVKWFGSKPKE